MAHLTFNGTRILMPGQGILDFPTTFDDWFLPSRDGVLAMNDNLRAFGVGDFADDRYYTSTEVSSLIATSITFPAGTIVTNLFKTNLMRVRAGRSFTAGVAEYALRDVGPAGGLIYYIDGTTYYEAAPSDQSADYAWSNVDNVEIGVTAQGLTVGTGQGNTTAIINQIGHTTSAAKLCNDLVI